MSGKVALQVNAIVGMASAIAACAIMWLVLTRPTDVAVTVANRDYEALMVAVGHQLGAWLQALLRYV